MLRASNQNHLLICLALTCALPSVCFANGWVSGVNSFRQTPEFYFIFAAILLVETVLLWLFLKPTNALSILWRVLLMNAISSLAGDALFRLDWAPRYGQVWKQAIPFFFLTIALEIPSMRFLFCKNLLTWKRTSLIGLTANAASYALLIVIDRPVRETWFNKLRAEDQRILNQWNNTQMLSEATGRIYATESEGNAVHRLKYFDFTDRQWHSVSNSPALDPRHWHVEGNLLAFVTYRDAATHGLARLTTLPKCEVIHDFPMPQTSYYSKCSDIAISPDGSKLAVVAVDHEIHAPLSGSSYQMLGTTCLLAVIDIATGKMTLCPRKASGTLCWLPDSRTILFHSLRDEKLHELTNLPPDWNKTYDLNKPNNPFLHPGLFAYHLDTSSVKPFTDISSPSLAPDARRLIFRDGEDGLGLIDLDNNKRSRIPLGRMSDFRELGVSPDGRFALVSLLLSSVSYWGYPTIVDLHNPSQRYYFGHTDYSVKWARTAAQGEDF